MSKRLGLPRRPRTGGGRKISARAMADFHAMRMEGVTVTVMAEVLGCTSARISQIAREQGLPPRRGDDWKPKA